MSDERLKIAVFIDFDNIEIGVKTTLNAVFDVGTILEAIKERGEVITKIAYGDWKRAGDHSRLLTQHAIRMVQRNVTPGGDKNGADINLALDALEMALTHEHINAFVIVGGDSDFISLVEKLKQYDKKVLVVGGRAFTSAILQKNCHEFIAYENLIAPQPAPRRQERARGSGQQAAAQQQAPAGPSALASVFPLVQRALKVLSEREVSPQLGLFKSTLLQLDSTFSEREYGASSFRDFAEKLADAGLVTLKQSGRSMLVELKDGGEPVAAAGENGRSREAQPEARPREIAQEGGVREAPADGREAPQAAPESTRPEATAAAGAPFDAVRLVQRAFESLAAPPRWPMYVRNVKQVVRSYDPAFDERRYGFAGILDLLRSCQRESVLRLERDRQGVLRVFAGSALQRPAVEAEPVAERPAESAIAAEPVDAAAAGATPPAAAEVVDVEADEAVQVVEPEPVMPAEAEQVEIVEALATTPETEEGAEPRDAEAREKVGAAGAPAAPASRGRRRRAPARPATRRAAAPRKPRAPSRGRAKKPA